jgi:hypothetical protein
VLEVFKDMEFSDIEQNCMGHSPDQLFCSISEVAVFGTSASRTMCMAGQIQGVGIKILVDSGSSHTFISSSLAAQLQGVCPLKIPTQVQVANGQNLVCSDYFPHTEWKFDLRVLPLTSDDMILGLDWLEAHNPMKVQCEDRWMYIPYDGATILLCGSAANLPVGTVIQLCSVQTICQPSVETQILEEIQLLIEEFGSLFVVPNDLPPTRACDHSIPLIEGAAPFSSRPYRFAPALKNEIEKQISDLLKN